LKKCNLITTNYNYKLQLPQPCFRLPGSSEFETTVHG